MEILGTVVTNDYNLDEKYAQRARILAENNLGVVMMKMGKNTLAKKYFQSTIERMNRLCS